MIRKAKRDDVEAIDQLSEAVILNMQQDGIQQWTLDYPRKVHFLRDIEQSQLYVYESEGTILGAMVFYEAHEEAYRDIDWLRKKSIVIHRFFVAPQSRIKGIGDELLYYALDYAALHGYESIKIDTYAPNYRMRSFLKRHHFIELDYLPKIDRIAYERLIEKNKMKKIIILGSSGTGKTTLSRMLGEKLHIPYLHLDSVYWERDWTPISKALFAHRVRDFLRTNKRYVIDGNYTNSVTFKERLQHADTIIMLDYPRQDSLKGIHAREKTYRHRYRSDMASGCIEGIDQEFLHYVYHFNEKKYKLNAVTASFAGRKYLLRFKNRRDLMRWLAYL